MKKSAETYRSLGECLFALSTDYSTGSTQTEGFTYITLFCTLIQPSHVTGQDCK